MSKYPWSKLKFSRSQKLAISGTIIFLTSCKADFAWHVIDPTRSKGASNLEFMLEGYAYTLSLSVSALCISTLLGLCLALPGFNGWKRLKVVSRIYVEVFRAIPLMALVLWVFYGLPIFLGIQLGPFSSGILALALSDAAFEAEIFRAGIQSVAIGQKEAAQALGLNKWQVFRQVVLPQAIRRILPAMGNQFVYMLKMSAIVSVIGLTELTKKANELVVTTYRPLEIYTFLILEYFALILVVSWLVKKMERKMTTEP